MHLLLYTADSKVAAQHRLDQQVRQGSRAAAVGRYQAGAWVLAVAPVQVGGEARIFVSKFPRIFEVLAWL